MLEKQFDFALLGKQSIDDDYVQTGQMLASLMNVPCATFSSEIELTDKSAKIMREVDFGMQQVEMDLPCVFTVDLRLNTPRFANVQNILKAKKKKVEVIQMDSLGIDTTPRLKIERVDPPSEREGGVLVADVDELLSKLRDEAKVL